MDDTLFPGSQHTRSRSIPSALRDYAKITTPKSAPHTSQQKILHTRHARFSAQSLSFSNKNASTPQLTRSSENNSPYFTSPRSKKRAENAGENDRVETSSNISTDSAILNEITNINAYRSRGLKRRGTIPIFQETPDQRALAAQSPSVYDDATSDAQSPSISDTLRDDSNAMGLREVSGNVQRSSPGRGSPYYRSVRGSPNRKGYQQHGRFNQDEYIEHIENELQMVKESMYSPTTHLPWKEKLKKAKEENQQLRKEIDAMTITFEHEMRQSIEQSTETELKLKRRIKDLEDEIEQNQTTIHNLEYTHEQTNLDQTMLDTMRARIDKLEEDKVGLEATNRDMTKRNEVLAQLLALSPTKIQPSMEFPTPRRRSARPMSLIIPRIPSSPGLHNVQSRAQSAVTSPVLAASDYFHGVVASSPLASSPLPHDDSQSVDSGLGESCAPVTNGTGSRRSTLASYTSSSPEMPLFGHGRAESRSQSMVRQPSKRRPRKFMPGSTQLKPLLLPTFTADNGNLPSTSPITSPVRQIPIQFAPPIRSPDRLYHRADAERTVSVSDDTTCQSPQPVIGLPGPAFQSLDEVFAHDARQFRGSSFDRSVTESVMSRQSEQFCTPVATQSSSVARMRILGPGPDSSPRVNSWLLNTMSSLPQVLHSSPQHINETLNQTVFRTPRERRGSSDIFGRSRKSTQQVGSSDFASMNSVEIPQPLFSHPRSSTTVPRGLCHSHPETPLNHRKRRKTSSVYELCGPRTREVGRHNPLITPPDELGQGHTAPAAVSSSGHDTQLGQTHVMKTRPRSMGSRNPLEVLAHRGLASKPLASLTIRTVYATLSRYTTYIQGFRQDPLALARRVIANAWRSNWAVFGKLSWWVLGLFLGHNRPRLHHSGWDDYDGESIAYRCCNQDSEEAHETSRLLPHNAKVPASAGDVVEEQETAGSSPSPPADAASPEGLGGLGKTLFLWGKFSVAIMLAVGGAIVKGPGEMLRDVEERRKSRRSSLADASSAKITSAHEAATSNAATKIGQPSVISVDQALSPTKRGRFAATPRKTRSRSSPVPNGTAVLDFERLETDHNDASTSRAHLQQIGSPDNQASFADENTLRPAKSERKGLQAVFDSPDRDYFPAPAR